MDKQTAETAIQFLNRVDLKVPEMNAMIAVLNALSAIVNAPAEPPAD
jgi:hypothetical protein